MEAHRATLCSLQAGWLAVKCSEITVPHRAALAMVGVLPPIVFAWVLGERLVRGMTLGATR